MPDDFDFDSIIIDDNTETIESTAWQYAEMLLDQSALPEDQKVTVQYEINDCQFAFELQDIINRLKECQPDRIDGGGNYGQKDILRKLRSFI